MTSKNASRSNSKNNTQKVAQHTAVEKLVTPAQAAQLKDVSRTAIYGAIAEGRLPARRVLGRLALEEADVLAWTPVYNPGRSKGFSVSQETKKRMAAAQKRRWANHARPGKQRANKKRPTR